MKLLPGGNPWIANGVTTWRGVRTKRHTYARLLDRGPWVLYDNTADPNQLRNLVGKPEHAGLQTELEARTRELMEEAADPGDEQGGVRAWGEAGGRSGRDSSERGCQVGGSG